MGQGSSSESTELALEHVARTAMPYLIPLPAVLAAITLWPPLTTWLPGAMPGK